MGGLFKQFKTSADSEVNGIEVKFEEATNDDGTIPTFVIARMGKSNKAYSKALEAKTRPVRRLIELGTLPNEKAEDIFKDVFVDNVLKGWSNVYDEAGEAIPYTRENALMLMEALPDVYDRLTSEAGLAANFLEAAREKEAKN